MQQQWSTAWAIILRPWSFKFYCIARFRVFQTRGFIQKKSRDHLYLPKCPRTRKDDGINESQRGFWICFPLQVKKNIYIIITWLSPLIILVNSQKFLRWAMRLRTCRYGISWISEKTMPDVSSVYKCTDLIASMGIVPSGWEDESPVSWQEALLTLTKLHPVSPPCIPTPIQRPII